MLFESLEEVRSVGISAVPLTQFFATRVEPWLVNEEALPGAAEFGPEVTEGRAGNGVYIEIGGAFAEGVNIAAGFGPNSRGVLFGMAVELRLPGGGNVDSPGALGNRPPDFAGCCPFRKVLNAVLGAHRRHGDQPVGFRYEGIEP